MKDLVLNLDSFSQTQQGIYFTQSKHPNSSLYNVGGYAFLKTKIQIPFLLDAIREQLNSYNVIVNRYSYFETTSSNKTQDLDIEFIDYSNKKDGENLCLEWMNSDVKESFDSKYDLLKIRVFKIESNCFYWYVKVHHILFDGYSMQLFFNNVIKHYNALNENKNDFPIKINAFADYVNEEIHYKTSKKYTADKLFWENKFGGFEKNSAFETCLNSKSKNNYLHTIRVEIPIPRTIYNQIETFCLDNKLTVSHYFIGLISLLNKAYGNGSFVLELPVFNRDNAKYKNTLGPFVKTLPFYVNFLENTHSFLNLLNTIKSELTACYRHKKYPLIDLLTHLNTRENLHNIIFSYQKNTYSEKINETQPVITFLNNGEQEEDLQFHLLEYSETEDLILAIDYKTEVFSEIVIKNLIRHFTCLFQNQYKQDTLVDYLSKAEEQQLIIDFNNTKVEYPKDKTIVDLFEQQVNQTPNNVALVFEEKELTYKELNEQSNQLASYIRETYNIQPDNLVGVLLERSEWMIIAILGVLKSGAAYVPIDPEYPKERIDYMLEDSQCKALINNQELEQFKNVQINYSKSNLQSITKANNLAYVIYTSGSTGKPKGVMIEHSSVYTFINWSIDEFKKSNIEVVFGVTSVCFDLSIFEIFYTLSTGKKIRILFNALSIPNYIKADEKILLNTVPSVVGTLLNNKVDFSCVAVLNMAGEPIPKNYIEAFDLKNIELRNLYGPSEDTTYSTIYRINNNGNILIGKPISNTQIYILNNHNTLQPIGVIGEICIGGDGLARGYLNKPDLTAEKFVNNPFKEGERMYKTGDLGMWLPDGNIEFIGRKDDQVKIRGYRIELGEIESALTNNELIEKAVVIAKANQAGEKELVAYVTSKSALNIQDLRTHLSSTLPAYMVPSYFVQLESIPLNANGKVDKKQLPSPEEMGLIIGVEYVAPRNQIEEKLVQIWEEILDRKNIGIKDSFFDLGGHSLKATRLSSKIYKELNIKLELKDLFTHPILEQQANLINQTKQIAYLNIPRISEQPNYDLSSAQRRLWVLSQFEESNVSYNIPGVYVFEGDLNIALLEEAFKSLIARHEILRTSFKEDEQGEVKQFILPIESIPFKISYQDLLSDKQQQSTLNSLISQDFSQSFDLRQGALLRANVYQVETSKYIFTYVMHHIVSDGWSMGILVKEVLTFYKAYIQNTNPEIKPLTIQYKDYAAWQQSQLKEHAIESHKNYWLNQFCGELPVLELPTDKPRPLVKTANGVSINKILNQTLSKNFKALCQKNGSTLFMGLLASVNTLLYRYTNQEDIIIGSPIAGREHVDLEDQIGFYINTVALRSQFKGENNFEELLAHTKQITLEAYKHQSYPFDELVDQLHLQRDLSRSALFDVMVVLQNTENNTSINNQQSLGDLKISVYENDNYSINSKFDITFTFSELGDHIHLAIQYNSDLYHQQTIKRLASHLENLITSVIKEPNLSINQVNYLSKAEEQQLIIDFNNTKVEYPKDKTIVDLFEQQVNQTPNNVALVFEEKELTYKELNEQSNQLASYIRETYNIQPDNLVGVLLERSEWMIIAILGVLKSGAAYVPIDPEYPKERIDYMLEDSQCKALINNQELEQFKNIQINYSKSNLQSITKANNLAYVIYTSGSTGKPKGVMIEHSSVYTFINWSIDEFKKSNIEVVFGVTSVCFDLSIFEIFYTLSTGKKIRILFNALSIPNYIKADEKILLNTVPSVVGTLLNNKVDFSCVAVLNMAGEPIPKNYIEAFDLKNIELRNLYGPSEDTTYSTIYRINNNGNILIGKPISNTQIYILNNHNTLQPIGVIGEICIGGDGLARGYLNKPDLTAEKFVNNPFKEGERMYKTGDLGMWLPDGNIEFIGRKDDQVKIRGYRIELGEIESALTNNELIEKAVVIAKANQAGEKELVAYVTSKSALNIQDLRTHLSSTLPAYMVPSYFVQLESIPLNANGKVDKKQLPSPEEMGLIIGVEYVAPRNQIEEKLVQIWEEILDRKNIGIKDSFFDLGGHSLKATRLSSKIYKELNIKLELKDLFTHPILEQQANLINQTKQIAYLNIPRISEQPNYDLSSAQRRLWVLSQFEESNVSYNIPGVYVFEGDLNIALLEEAFKSLIARHEILRTSFKEDEQGEVKQFILPIESIPFKISYQDLLSDKQQQSTLNSLISQDFSQSFDLRQGALLRANVYQVETSKYIFTYVMHHIVSDGWSMGILVKEVLTFYKAYIQNTNPEIKPLTIQYKDYAAWQQSQLKEHAIESHKNYWLNQFCGELPVLELPTDKPRPLVKTANGVSINKILNQTLSKNFKALCQKNGSTLFMGLLASVNTLLYRYTNQEDIIIGSPIAGREHADLEDQIGFYINTVALRSQFKGENNFEELLAHTKQITLEAYKHQSYPFDELVDQLHLQRDLSRSALFDIWVVLQNSFDFNEYFKEDNFSPFKISNYNNIDNITISKFDLKFTFIEKDDCICLNLEYNKDIFDKYKIINLVEHLEQLILSVLTETNMPINQLNYLTQKEKQCLLIDFNNTKVEYPKDKTIIDLFEQQVQQTPNNVALVFEEKELTYKELNEQSNQLANYLQETYNIQPNNLVGVLLERSEWMIIAILGVLKSGAAYVPIDLEYPKERIDYMINDSQCKVLVNIKELEHFKNIQINYSKSNPQSITKANNLAYVIYTSGSTGKPKGVMIENKGLLDYFYGVISKTNILNCKTFGLVSTIAADLGNTMIYSSLLIGASLHIFSADEIMDSDKMSKCNLECLKIVPSHWKALQQKDKMFAPSKCLIFGGDQLTVDIVTALRLNNATCNVYNHYGPTETTIGKIIKHINLQDLDLKISLGKPFGNNKIYILDNKKELLPVGVNGEICISGDGLSKGYLNKPKLTEEKFKLLSFVSGERIYATGDIGRWLTDGNIEFIGRKDDQVKIHGYRVELDEIKNALLLNDIIQSAFVTKNTLKNGDEKIFAYIVSNTILNDNLLRDYLITKLPAYMIPHHFFQLESIPLTINGKVDRKKLPDSIDFLKLKNDSSNKPINETEKKLVLIWQEILENNNIDVLDNFFDLGGNSLKIIKMVGLIHQEFKCKISIVTLFKFPNIRFLSEHIDSNFIEKTDTNMESEDSINKINETLKLFNIDDNE